MMFENTIPSAHGLQMNSFTLLHNALRVSLCAEQSQCLGALQAGGAGLAGFRCGAQVSELHCVPVAHKKLLASWSWESSTCRENCWSFLLSLAVNLPLLFSSSFKNNCTRKWMPSLWSCLPLEEIISSIFVTAVQCEVLTFLDFLFHQWLSIWPCSGGVRKCSYIKHIFFFFCK